MSPLIVKTLIAAVLVPVLSLSAAAKIVPFGPAATTAMVCATDPVAEPWNSTRGQPGLPY